VERWRSSNSIRIDYLNEDNGHSLSVHVYPKDFKIKSEKDESFSLSNGIKAKIIDDKRIDFIFITFIDNDLKYLIGINKNMFENSKACTEELIKVANSMK
jgi:ABC-type molybdate transport system ATPase subunit